MVRMWKERQTFQNEKVHWKTEREREREMYDVEKHLKKMGV
jgi:hypothetical protein